jgi:hypothetical protein
MELFNPSLTLFNGDVSWNVENNTENFDLNQNYRINRFKNLTKILLNSKVCEVEAIERIGSDSSMGEVYKYEIEKNFIAIKILPIINSRSKKINENEINLAKEVSSLVINKKSSYFPIVYYDIFCESTFYYEHKQSKFAIQSLNYQYYLYLKNLFKDEPEVLNSIDSYYKLGKNLNDLVKEKYGDLLEVKININSQLLFSELAYTDLKNYLTKRISKDMLNEIVFQSLEGIRDLQTMCNIVHNDLHLGNILLLFNPENKIQILIHDFGRSIKAPFLSLIRKKTDIRTFIIEIKKYVDIYMDGDIHFYFIEKIQNVIENLDDNNSDYPINDIINLWIR